MRLFYNRSVAIVLFAALSAVLVARGIVPAMSKIDSDFPGYFTAAKIVADGGPVERLYDDVWFQQQMHRYVPSSESIGKFSPFPPPTAFLLLPLTRMEPLNALRVVTIVSALCLAGSIVLLARILSLTLVESAVFILLSGYAVINTLRFGQPYIAVSFSCIAGYYAYLKNRPVLAGMFFGLFLPFKYFPAVILIYFAFRKDWKVVMGGGLVVSFISLVSIGVLGWKIHEIFLSSVLGNHLVGVLSEQDPYTASFQSFDTLFRRLFVYDAALNPRPWLAFPPLQTIGVLAAKASIILAALAALIKLARSGIATATAPSIGILGVLTLLEAPATATYHFVLLWMPVGLLVHHLFCERDRASGYFILGTYALIGFLPYGHTQRFEGRGGLTVLAYPRLFVLLTMFIASVYFIWNRGGPAREASTTDLSPCFQGSTQDDAG
jgi:Glycosyltransferase family 87